LSFEQAGARELAELRAERERLKEQLALSKQLGEPWE